MNYSRLMITLILCQPVIIQSMERPHKRGIYPPVQLPADEQPRKKPFWQEPHLLKHGAYLAFVENFSGKELRTAIVPLRPIKEPDESYAFITDEDRAETLDIVYAANGSQASKRFFIPPTTGSNDISAVEAFCLLVETTQTPRIRKLLWVLRSIDHEEKKCKIYSYFHDKPNVRCVENEITKKNLHSKMVTLINLRVPDSDLQNITAKTQTFAARPS